MSSDTDPTDALEIAMLFGRAVEAVGGRYFIGGSLASSLQGEPRSTNDIDVVVDLPLGRIGALAAALGGDFEVDVPELRRAIADAGTCNIFYLPLVTKIDVFGLGTTPFDEIEFARRRELAVRPTGERLWFKSPEDTVLRKLLWFRDGGNMSSKQWRDVVQVLRVSGPAMDRAYLDTWATRLQIAESLANAWREAEA